MTSAGAADIARRYTALTLACYLAFMMVSLLFAGITVLSPDIFETAAYEDRRKVMAMGYTLLSVTLLLGMLALNTRANAMQKLGLALMAQGDIPQMPLVKSAFRTINPLWILSLMAATIITVNYTVLIYAVEGGLF